MQTEPRSGCPINLALELFGDRWTLLIIRDLMFAGKRHFGEFSDSEEGVSSSVLSERLNMLTQRGVIRRTGDPTHKQKAVYRLTQMGIDMLPIVIQIGIWSRAYLPVNPEHARHAEEHAQGGPLLWAQIRRQLEIDHLGADEPVP